ncbi:MAG: DNA translocase FtsK, partial [Lachnospiraceae bacterium]|nr:DNA translocase FtsK [Lachnospiraceae bacterium]
QKAAGALMWGVGEMEKRYRLFAEYAVRDLKGYNAKAVNEGKDPIPQLVIIVDELADLMMSAKSDVENSIVRLAQKARAAGIHLIIATQRPSVDVITGLIKANMPSRIAFTVTSGTDSRTILDMVGAEKLLGRGDMLFHPVGYPKPARVQGAFVSDGDVEKVAEYCRNQKKEDDDAPDINDEIEQNAANASTATTKTAGNASDADDGDELFLQVADFVVNLDKPNVSIGLIQRKFRLGFNRAARIMDELHDAGIVGDEAGTKGRTILMDKEKFESYKEENL